MRRREFIAGAAASAALTHPANAMGTAAKNILLWGNRYRPSVNVNFLTTTALSSVFSSTISFARTGNAMMYDATGKLTYAPNNLLLYSSDFSNAAWVMNNTTIASGAPSWDGTNNAWTLTDNTTNAEHRIYNNTGLTIGANQILVIYAKAGTAAFVGLSDGNSFSSSFNLSNGTVFSNVNCTGTIVAVPGATGWYEVSVVVPNKNLTYFVLNMGTTAVQAIAGSAYVGTGSTVLIANATASIVTYETTPRPADQVITTSAVYYGPRLDYDPVTLAPKGLLIEEARTNLLKNSNDVSSVWTTQNATPGAIAGVSPDGTNNAQSLTAIAIGLARTYQAITAAAGAYTVSVWVKNVSMTQQCSLALSDGNAFNASVNFTASSTWQRIILSGTTVSGYPTLLLYLNPDNNSGAARAGEAILFYGAQLEAGSFPTSYIPTAAAAVTRAADVVQLTGAALTTVQGAAASIVVQETTARNDGGGGIVDGNNLYFFYAGTSLVKTYNAATGLNLNSGVITQTQNVPYRAAITYSAGHTAIGLNGYVASQDAAQALPITSAQIGYGSGGYLDGWVQLLAVYKTQLPDDVLKAKSVVGAPL